MAYVPQVWENGVSPLSDERFNHMEEGIANAGGGGGGGTVYVTAFNAKTPAGEFQCDGVDDQVTIQAAIDSLPTINSAKRGTVVLSEGQFKTSAPIVWPNSHSITLVGQGGGEYSTSSVTWIHLIGAIDGPVIDAIVGTPVLRNLEIYNNSTLPGPCVETGAGGGFFENCIINSDNVAYHTGIERTVVSGSSVETRIRGCTFYTNGACIKLNNPYFVYIDDCYFYGRSNLDFCVELIGDAAAMPDLWNDKFFHILNCRSDGNGRSTIKLTDGMTNGIIAGNEFWYDDEPAVLLEDCAGITIVNNQFGGAGYVGGAIRLDGSHNNVISNNLLFGLGEHGIALIDSDQNSVQNNIITNAGTDTTNTHSGIFLGGDSDDNLITGNAIHFNTVTSGAVETNKLKYGIEINAATCNDNIVYGNDVKGSYVTGGIGDAGTGTITTATNRT